MLVLNFMHQMFMKGVHRDLSQHPIRPRIELLAPQRHAHTLRRASAVFIMSRYWVRTSSSRSTRASSSGSCDRSALPNRSNTTCHAFESNALILRDRFAHDIVTHYGHEVPNGSQYGCHNNLKPHLGQHADRVLINSATQTTTRRQHFRPGACGSSYLLCVLELVQCPVRQRQDVRDTRCLGEGR